MISKKDSKPFKIKFAVGIEKNTKSDDMLYLNDWHTCYGLIRDTITDLNVNLYGYEALYDKVITVNAGSKTRAINYDTLFIADNIPTSVYETGDYSVKRIYPEYNGEIIIGLTKKKDVNIPKLYFEDNGKILYCQMNFDKKTLKAYVPNKTFLPFKEGDYVWTREPVDNTVQKNRLKFISKTKTGLDKGYKNFYELTFIKE